jgi:hypothetical protein
LRETNLDWRVLLPAAAAVGAAAGLLTYWLRRHRDNPDDIERQRRAFLNKIGRICEGQVIEMVERAAPLQSLSRAQRAIRKSMSPNSMVGRKLLCYTYSISGVTYETAQDITGLEQRIHLERLAAGQPASVKYDPSNPSNSILIADDWSGLG